MRDIRFSKLALTPAKIIWLIVITVRDDMPMRFVDPYGVVAGIDMLCHVV